MVKDGYQNSIKTLQLAGLGDRTQESYTRAVRMLSEFYRKTSDLVTEEELQDYFLSRMMIHVRYGKGSKDCFIPLPLRTLKLLRENWKIHRNLRLLFPAKGEMENPQL